VKISVCQLPDELSTRDLAWKRLVRRLDNDRPDIALLNEMPFGPWVSRHATPDESATAVTLLEHEIALNSMAALTTAIISSRPVRNARKLANEAFLMAHGDYQAIHHKHYFPQEPGFFEASWFAPARPGFDVAEFRGVRIGVLLCTELMFSEWARHYRRQGAHVIVCPRASGTSMTYWDAAARMAAIVSGCYVLSSNRAARAPDSEPRFGGRGFAYSPTGELIGETSEAVPFLCVDIDRQLVAETQRKYPCYLRELPGGPASESSRVPTPRADLARS
jgi:N-carbamoylputrescine amidase